MGEQGKGGMTDLLKEDRQSIMQNNKEEYEWRRSEKAFFLRNRNDGLE